MAKGPGKYDETCVMALAETSADICVLIVINGKSGSGFSVISKVHGAEKFLPKVLRDIADQLDEEN